MTVQPRSERLHFPVRPGWHCGACREEWPCDKAQLRLLSEYRGFLTSLSCYMSTFMFDMVTDFAGDESRTRGTIHVRCLGWVADATRAERRAPEQPTAVTAATPSGPQPA